MKILVRNLARSTTEEELAALFEPHGTVQSCNLVVDSHTGISKGFGFVEMPKPGDAKAAIKTLNGADIAGYKIRVKKAEPKPAGTGPYPAANANADPKPVEKQPYSKTAVNSGRAKPDETRPAPRRSPWPKKPTG
ncbi:MAG: RNA-binding protein [Gammaproteobacteria bacterium]|nr:MAG: RNA-binding protein [Gammaproteobacteria bacterium]RLA15073.1 MAG: RNA-binding protein [Gammaproteobacteria bacterium]